MKKTKLFLIAGMFSITITTAHAQFAVVDAAAGTLLTTMKADNIAHYAQMVEDAVTQIEHLKTQIEYAVKMEQMAIANLKNAGKIKNFDDAKNWTNRQLYLEQKAEKAFTSSSINIGGKKYNYKNITEIPGAYSSTFLDYDFAGTLTEKERRDMWVKLGLTPSNYAYVKTWEAREKDVLKHVLAAEDRKKEREKKIADATENVDTYADDGKLPQEKQITINGLVKDIGRMFAAQLQQTGELNENMEKLLDIEASRAMLEKAHNGEPDISLKGLKDDEGVPGFGTVDGVSSKVILSSD